MRKIRSSSISAPMLALISRAESRSWPMGFSSISRFGAANAPAWARPWQVLMYRPGGIDR